MRGHGGVQRAEDVAEDPPGRGGGNDAAADLVAHRDGRDVGLPPRVGERAEAFVHALLPAVTLLPRAGLVEYPSQPGAEAVDEHGPVGLTQRSRDVTGLDGAP